MCTVNALLEIGFTIDNQWKASAKELSLLKGHKSWVLCLGWSPDALFLASGGMDGSIWLWQPHSGQPLGSCKGKRSAGSFDARAPLALRH